MERKWLTLDQIKAEYASNDYNPELLLQHLLHHAEASPASVPEGFTMSEPEILPDGSGFGTMTEREATLLGKVERQSAALKLAREALKFDGYPCGTGCKCIACEALAAIDALRGE